MMTNRTPYILFLLLMIVCSCSTPGQKPARLQLISMIPDHTATVVIEHTTDGSKQVKHTLAYATPSGYLELTPAEYTIRFNIEGQPVLEHTFALGAGSRQTLLAEGVYPSAAPSPLNKTTTGFTMMRMIAGAEAMHANGLYPQFIMLRDDYRVGPKESLIRFVHAAPFEKKVSIHAASDAVSLSLSYPAHSAPTALNESTPAQFSIGAINVSSISMNRKAGTLQTIIIGEAATTEDPLSITTYSAQ